MGAYGTPRVSIRGPANPDELKRDLGIFSDPQSLGPLMQRAPVPDPSTYEQAGVQPPPAPTPAVPPGGQGMPQGGPQTPQDATLYPHAGVDPDLIRDTLDRAARAGIVGSSLGMRTPNWYGVMHGQQPTQVNQGATQALERQAMAPLQADQARVDRQNQARDLLNRAAQMNVEAVRGNQGLMAQLAQSAAMGSYMRGRDEAAGNRKLDQIGAQGDEARQTDVQKAGEAKTLEDRKAAHAAELARIKAQGGQKKLSTADAQAVNKAQEIIDRGNKVEALIHKYGNLGPLLQYGTKLSAAARWAGVDSPIKDRKTGLPIPTEEVADDANELNGHMQYLINEAPRALAAANRMDAETVKHLAVSFPTGTDSENSSVKKIHQYIDHGANLIQLINNAKLGAVRERFYGGGTLPGPERGDGMPAQQEQEETKVVGGVTYFKRNGKWMVH